MHPFDENTTSSPVAALVHDLVLDHAQKSQTANRQLEQWIKKQPQEVLPFVDTIIHHFITTQAKAPKRNCIRLLQWIALTEAQSGLLFDTCLHTLIDKHQAVAVRAFSINVALKIATKYPELKFELEETLSLINPDANPGILSCRNKAIIALRSGK